MLNDKYWREASSMVVFITHCYKSQMTYGSYVRSIFATPFLQRDNDLECDKGTRTALLALTRCLHSVYESNSMSSGSARAFQNIETWANITLDALRTYNPHGLAEEDRRQLDGLIALVFHLWKNLLLLTSHDEDSNRHESQDFGYTCRILELAFHRYIRDGGGGVLGECGHEMVFTFLKRCRNHYRFTHSGTT